LALAAFLVSFSAARTFTTFFPHQVLTGGGLHIHHFWFGLLLLAVGGWLGISYSRKDISIVAAVLYGAGGGLIADEVGLLLTFGDYYSGLTWTFLVFIIAFALAVILFIRYRRSITEELEEFVGSKASPFVATFLAAVSIAFLIQTDNLYVTIASGALLVVAAILAMVFFIQRLRKNSKPN
jgi:hypothetical protein